MEFLKSFALPAVAGEGCWETSSPPTFPSAYWACSPELTEYGLKWSNYTILKVNSTNRPDTGRRWEWWHLKALLIYCCGLPVG